MSFIDAKNVFCVGRNYRLHAEELGNEVPTEPLFFSKPTHSLVLADGKTISLPGDRGEVQHEIELVLRIGKEERIEAFALGIDFTLRELQAKLKKAGKPWLPAKGFKNSALLTPFRNINDLSDLREDFSLMKNGKEVQRGNRAEMIFPLERILLFCSENFGLGEGDLIFTGTPEGVGKVENGDRLVLRWGEEDWGSCITSL
ncbi:MAG TPA: fumarylacetoacetate hydrolase [Cyanobacteria bacterium UBA8530]|nr:fumarylacetoacetate hydrolase [Cyanobacteria bacterium UBA8530]